MNEVFLDTETTGLSFKDGHKIVEIACIETKDLIATGKVFHELINPERDVPEEAFRIHGFSQKFLSNKKNFVQISEDFLKFIRGKKIIIHNANFDLSFLNGELRTANRKLIEEDNIIDSLEMARLKFPGASNSLDSLCKRFNVDLSRRVKHNALLDCELLREVYINLLDAKEPKFNLTSDNFDQNIVINKSYYKNILQISENEIKAHKDFIKKELKKNFY